MSALIDSQHLKIPLKEIEIATKNFQMCIGKGGYGMVYKGELSIDGNLTTVAVKRLNEQFGQGLKEFLMEIQLLTGQNHPNLITLIGYCDEGKEKIIVYEYAENGSLDQYLRRNSTLPALTWLERLKICVDAAHGLNHLHNHFGKHQTIIHRDIKSANILIDHRWVAKISDLGLSKLSLAGLNRSAVVSHACGTLGYCEPEYFSTGIVKKEADVYSFGMVLFEILCGRLCFIVGDDGFLLSAKSVKNYYQEKKLDEIVDPVLREQMSSDLMSQFATIAYNCLKDDRGERPPMDLVTKELEELLKIQVNETDINCEDSVAMEVISKDISCTETETEGEDTKNMKKREKKIEHKKILREATFKGDWVNAKSVLQEDEGLAREAISGDGSTVLHIAVGAGHNDVVKKLFSYINDEDLLATRNSDGCTSLHIAAIVGNKHAAELLVNKNPSLLRMKDHKREEPLHKAYENMHFDTIIYLLKAVNDDSKSKLRSSSIGSSVYPHPGVEIGVDLLVNAISAKQYKLASELVKKFPKFASKNDAVLMAIAQTFPNGLNHLETLIYPSLVVTWELISFSAQALFLFLVFVPKCVFSLFHDGRPSYVTFIIELLCYLLLAVPMMLISVLILAILLILGVWFLFLVFYRLLWKVAPINHIENKKKEWDEATKVLELVCDEIDKLQFFGMHHPYYTQPILEASCQNAYKVVNEILRRAPEAIQSRNESGYDIIQLSIINRSEKIYNIIYDIGERKNLYRTVEDSFKNNILHLASRLAPSHELNKRGGAALQLQRELQWREEVKKHVFPTYITRQNIFGETPDMVFTREHTMLVKETEKWMKTTAELGCITATLIATVVFAAAFTLPQGRNQETGIPVFTPSGASTVFVVSDVISLTSSSIALLVFLSILTTRFSENDFLDDLPRQLHIGFFSLLLSIVTMVVACGAAFFFVFSDRESWMLALICVLALIPIVFVNLRFPLIVDLFRSTYLPVFGKQRKSFLRRFNPDDIRLYFVK